MSRTNNLSMRRCGLMDPIWRRIIEKIRRHLGTAGLLFYEKLFYTHPLESLRLSMQGTVICGVIRSLRECDDWSADEICERWIYVVEDAIEKQRLVDRVEKVLTTNTLSDESILHLDLELRKIGSGMDTYWVRWAMLIDGKGLDEQACANAHQLALDHKMVIT